MKRLVLTVLLQLIIGLSFAQSSFSQTPLNQLGLPTNYETWPYTRTNSCQGNNKKIVTVLFGKFEPTSQETSVIAITTIDNELIYVVHTSGSADGATLLNQYLPSVTSTTVYNGLDSNENEKLKDLLSKRTQDALGMTKEEVSRLFMFAENCIPAFYQIDDLALHIFRTEMK